MGVILCGLYAFLDVWCLGELLAICLVGCFVLVVFGGLLRIGFLCVGREAQECTAKPVWTERGRAKPNQTLASTNCLWDWVVFGSCMFGVVFWLVLYNTCPLCLCVCGGTGMHSETSLDRERGRAKPNQTLASTNCLWDRVVVGSCMFGEVLLLVLYNASPWYLCVFVGHA